MAMASSVAAVMASATGSSSTTAASNTQQGDFFAIYDADLNDKASQIGKGAFSTVHRCVNRLTGEVCAVKVISTAKVKTTEIAKIEREIAICKRLKHTNIVQMRNAFKNSTHYYLVFEFVSGGELFDEIVARTFYSEKDASDCVYQILAGIKHCHDNNIIHRDLKPENLLLASREKDAPVKITDFGLAVIMENGPSYFGFAGTPGYLSPEVCRRIPYDTKVDVWACGVILYILLVGYPPFWDENQQVLYDQIKAANYDFPSPEWDTVTEDAKSLIRLMLQADPAKRISVDETLKHPWIATRDKVASQVHRQNTIDELKKFNARRKLKGGVNAVLGVNRMITLVTETPYIKGAKRASTAVQGLFAEATLTASPSNAVEQSGANASNSASSTRDGQHILYLNSLLLKSITGRDWETYTELCAPHLTCFEPESHGELIDGLEFHKFYFDNVPALPLASIHTTVLNPRVQLLGDAAITTCTRITQYLDGTGAPKSDRHEETRVWQRKPEAKFDWVMVHLHRSGSLSTTRS